MQGTGELLDRKKYITREEYARLLKVSKENIRAWTLFFVAGNTGVRVGEAHRITADDVSKTEDILVVRVEKQKDWKIQKTQVKKSRVEFLRSFARAGIRGDSDHPVKMRIEFSGGSSVETHWISKTDVAKVMEAGKEKGVQVSDPVVKIRVPRDEGGPRRPRDVHHEVISVLRKWIRDHKLKGSDLLFPWSKRQSQYYWQTYSRLAGLEIKAKDVGEGRKGRGIHCLRHLRGLSGSDAGGSLQQIKQLLGQKSESSAAVYAHTSKMKDLVKKIGVVR
jgi:integrase